MDSIEMKPLTLGKTKFDWGSRTYVMGILNITPDSFSGDGVLGNQDPLQAAVQQARAFLIAGVDILDIGGESTRPGSTPLSVDQEIDRVIPIVRALAEEFPEAIISIDTYKAAVADQAFRAGALLLNDVWGLRADPGAAQVAANHQAAVILMHNRSNPGSIQVRGQLGNAYQAPQYGDLIEDVKSELMESVQLARQAGIPDERIILDPGIGFGKTREQNMQLIMLLEEIRSLGFPVLIGPSRKSFIGYTLDLPPDQRVEGTAAAVTIGIMHGADIVRVHDVPEMVRVAKMTDAFIRTN
jgi:dihydropteroate synthase